MKKVTGFIAILTVSLALSGCGLFSANQKTPAVVPVTPNVPAAPSPTNEPTPSLPTNVPPVKTNEKVSISIENFTFNPTPLTIKKGSTVTWTNDDPAPHQIKSTTFNSNQLFTGQTFSFTFDTVGTYDYSCAIHPSMLGKIVVE